MFRPFYSAPVKLGSEFPLLPGAIRLPPPHVLTGGVNREPPPPGSVPAAQPPGFQSDKPWMTPQIVAEIRRRNHLQCVAASSGLEEHRAAAESARQIVNRLVNDAKERFCLAHPERTDEILQGDRHRRPHHCKACDRSYVTAQQLEEHCQEHVRCGLDDCPFTAHPRIVEKHVTMQHHTGLAKVIMSLNTPEAIEKWRKERKARFCRPESAALRQEQQAEKLARGIRMGSNRGRFPPREERAGRGRGQRGSRGRGRGGANFGDRGRKPALLELESDSDEEPGGGMKPFAGILYVEEDRSGDEVEDTTGGVCSDADVSVSGNLTGIIGEKNVSVDGYDGDVSTMSISATSNESTPIVAMMTDDTLPLVPFKSKASDDPYLVNGDGGSSDINMTEEIADACTPSDSKNTSAANTGEKDAYRKQNASAAEILGSTENSDIAISKTNSSNIKDVQDSTQSHNGGYSSTAATVSPGTDTASTRGRGGRHRRRGRGRGGLSESASDICPRPQPGRHPPRKRRRPLTLLEKLLAPDIERERNIILQCVRYIRQNQFFDSMPLLPGVARASPLVVASTGTAPDGEVCADARSETVVTEEGAPVTAPNDMCESGAECDVQAPCVSSPTESGGDKSAAGAPVESEEVDSVEPRDDKPPAALETMSNAVELPGALRLLGNAYDSDVYTDSE